MIDLNELAIPMPGIHFTPDEAIKLCVMASKFDLSTRLAHHKKELPEQMEWDGCTSWFDTWNGVELWRACFFHDLAYYIGGPAYLRTIADHQLAIDIANLMKASKMANIMYEGVRVGGSSVWEDASSWGFGIKNKTGEV